MWCFKTNKNVQQMAEECSPNNEAAVNESNEVESLPSSSRPG
jgi:hypothetical protein